MHTRNDHSRQTNLCDTVENHFHNANRKFRSFKNRVHILINHWKQCSQFRNCNLEKKNWTRKKQISIKEIKQFRNKVFFIFSIAFIASNKSRENLTNESFETIKQIRLWKKCNFQVYPIIWMANQFIVDIQEGFEQKVNLTKALLRTTEFQFKRNNIWI